MAYITKQERSEIMKNIRALLPQGWKAKASNIKGGLVVEIAVLTSEADAETLDDYRLFMRNRTSKTQTFGDGSMEKLMYNLKAASNCLGNDLYDIRLDIQPNYQ